MLDPVRGAKPSPQVRGAFSDYVHDQGEYGTAEAAERERRRQHRAAQEAISPRPFACRATVPVPGHAAETASLARTVKYDIDPYETKEDLSRVARRREQRKRIGPDFRPGGSTKDRRGLNRGKLMENLQSLGKTLQRDWKRSFDSILLNADGIVIVRFASRASNKSVVAYMNHLMRSNAVIDDGGFRKDATRWGSVVDSGLFFGLIPAWIRERPEKAAVHVHNERL